MTPGPFEQRTPYKGTPNRPWIRLRLMALDGSTVELELVADTGSPFAIILGAQHMSRLEWGGGTDRSTNFGQLRGFWLELAMPELGLSGQIHGYASDTVWAAVKADHPDFEGLIGLPLLRLVEYGGNADWFWVRPISPPPVGRP